MLKVMKIDFPLLLVMVLLASCKTNSKYKYVEIEPFETPAVELGDKEWPFTMYHSASTINWPVVRIKIGESYYHFLVDTGAPSNSFYSKPDPTMSVVKEGNARAFGLDTEVNGLMRHISFTDFFANETGFSSDRVDGLIGIDFMSIYDNVVFDYINRKIIFDAPPISEDDIPMVHEHRSNFLQYIIEFTVDGNKEYGLIDTGSSVFSVREKFGDGNYPLIKDLNRVIKLDGKPKLENINNFIAQDIHIGSVRYKESIATPWNSKYLFCMDSSRKFTKYTSVLGSPFWNDHIIQLDFYNDVFRIK